MPLENTNASKPLPPAATRSRTSARWSTTRLLLAYFCGGVGMTLVGAAAIAAVLDADVGPRSQIVALVVFSCVAFAQTAIPLLSLEGGAQDSI